MLRMTIRTTTTGMKLGACRNDWDVKDDESFNDYRYGT